MLPKLQFELFKQLTLNSLDQHPRTKTERIQPSLTKPNENAIVPAVFQPQICFQILGE